MANQTENSIIYRLPRELQIQCLQLLIPNERILVVGYKNVGKTNFINLLQEQEQENIHKKAVQIMELNKDKIQFNKNPTKIIFICDTTSSISISQIHNHYIPTYKHLRIPFTVIINKTDISPSKWKIQDIIIVQTKIRKFEKELGITIPIHWISNKKNSDYYTKKSIIFITPFNISNADYL